MTVFFVTAERRGAMHTVKRNPFLAGAAAVLGGVLLAGVASAELGSDKAGAIVIFPQLVANANANVDSVIQLTNTSPNRIAVRCFLVNANSHCSNAGAPNVPIVCTANSDCNPTGITGGICVAGWQETDFRFQLTARQPIYWKLSEGLPIFPLDGLLKVGPPDPDTGLPMFNEDSAILPAGEDPFQGELKCVQVDVNTELPRQGTDESNNFTGDLIGEVTIVDADVPDARSYNAIGIQAVPDANDEDNVLLLGVEYDGCPSVLILDHFFDDANEPINNDTVRTNLTLIPCSQNFLIQDAGRISTTVQILVFNEFEQRFSSHTSVSCYKNIVLSDIASRPGTGDDSTSVFNVAVMGTLTGQTRLRGVDNLGRDDRGDGLLAVAEEFHSSGRSAAFNVHFTGIRSRPDVIVLGPEQ
jgi:hypothetical protein